MTSVVIDSVSKAFGRINAVSGASIELESRSLMALIGPSGAGKSTLCRLIAGLETPDQGAIRFGDRDVTRVPAEKRDVGMVFQQFALYERMSVADNLDYPLRSRVSDRRERIRRVRDIADRLDITDLLPRRAGQLSGGQKQRVAIGRAVVRRPPVLLMDEPFSNVDPFLRRAIRQELTQLLQRLELTTILVTHSLEDAYEMATHVAIMSRGRVIQAGLIRDTYDCPATIEVAELTSLDGTISVPCHVEANTLHVAGAELPLLEKDPLQNGTALIRKDAWYLGNRTGDASFRVQIRGIRWAGRRFHVTVTLAATADQAWVIYLPDDHGIRIGEHATLSVRKDHIHVFDEGGARRPLLLR